MLISSSNDNSTSFRAELIKLSSPIEVLKHSRRSPSVSTASRNIEIYHAAPIMPLQDRDFTEMAKLFERQDADEIEADINRALLWLSPEPCWDEEFDFLGEFL